MITLYGNFYQNHLRLAKKLREKNTNILKSCQCTVYYHCWDLGKKDSLLVVKRYRISSVTFAPIFYCSCSLQDAEKRAEDEGEETSSWRVVTAGKWFELFIAGCRIHQRCNSETWCSIRRKYSEVRFQGDRFLFRRFSRSTDVVLSSWSNKLIYIFVDLLVVKTSVILMIYTINIT